MESSSTPNNAGQNTLPEVSSRALRKQMGKRLLYTVFFLFILQITVSLTILTLFFQYAYLFFFLKHSEEVRQVANKMCSYVFELMRFITLNSNEKPFPFKDFPKEFAATEKTIFFDL